MDDVQNVLGTAGQDVNRDLPQARKQLAFVGRRIRELRTERGCSQESFALQIGLARSYYGALERGERNLSVVLLLRIAAGLKVEVSTLLPPLSDLLSAEHDGVGVGEQGQGQEQDKETTGQRIETQHTQATQSTQEGQAAKEVSYVSTGAAAKVLGVNRRTIARWVAEGVLDALLVEDSNGRLVAVFQREVLSKIADK